MSQYDELFTPLQVRHVKLCNRVVVPPMVQMRNITSPEGIAWYRRLAAGGPGLVIVEATGVPRFGEDLTAETLGPLVEAIHWEGAAAAIQLFPIRFGERVDPDGLSAEQISAALDQYAAAAAVCREAGFDAVEPHGAHGFVLNQFFMPDRNHRGDCYGGSLENRCRLGSEIVARIRESAGPDLLILYRHSPAGAEYGIDDSLHLARSLIDAGLDVLDISPAKRHWVADMAEPFKAHLDVPVIAVNDMDDPDEATAALREGRCDLVAVGRQMIADARWPKMLQAGELPTTRKCRKCDEGCHGNIARHEPVECVLWDDAELTTYMG